MAATAGVYRVGDTEPRLALRRPDSRNPREHRLCRFDHRRLLLSLGAVGAKGRRLAFLGLGVAAFVLRGYAAVVAFGIGLPCHAFY